MGGVRVVTMLVALAVVARGQTNVEYIGGTMAPVRAGSEGKLDLRDERYLAFYAAKEQVRVPYDRINLLEYGQQIDRRLALALLLSPVFLLSKARKHFLTIGYQEGEMQQALVFRVDKGGIRGTLAALEARTGLKVDYQEKR